MTDDAQLAPSADASTPALEVTDLSVWYGGAIHAVRGMSMRVMPGALVALLGANGAGKTSLLRAITGLLPFHGGAIRAGAVRHNGHEITGLPPSDVVKRRISQVMEGRRMFADLTVAENLRAGGFTRKAAEVNADYALVMEMFPSLAARERTAAGYLSGGEQQMVAIGRAMMQKPDVLLLDEPSLGLAPIVVQRVFEMIKELNRRGTSVVVIEQNVGLALSAADYAYVLDRGSLVAEGPASMLLDDESVRAAYLGASKATGESEAERGVKPL